MVALYVPPDPRRRRDNLLVVLCYVCCVAHVVKIFPSVCTYAFKKVQRKQGKKHSVKHVDLFLFLGLVMMIVYCFFCGWVEELP